VREPLLAWLNEHATNAEASFIYRAWLDAGGDKDIVRKPLLAWLNEHATDADARFVYKAWLDAGGDKDVVREPLLAWLNEHGTEDGAQFVYKAWLDAGGDKDVVREPLLAWLNEHGTDDDADFVYKAWLEAGGDFSPIRSLAIQWLHQNHERAESVFLTKFLAKQHNIPVDTIKDILKWCKKFPNNEDALWRLTQLGENLMREEIAEYVLTTSEAVLSPLLPLGAALTSTMRGKITVLLAYLIRLSYLQPEQLRGPVDTLLLSWLRNPISFGDDPKPHRGIQQMSYVQRVADLLASSDLNISTDREPLERFAHWVNNWELEKKLHLRRIFEFLKREYPAPGVWDIVEFS
jgi:ferritin